jgi:hypothetical protein
LLPMIQKHDLSLGKKQPISSWTWWYTQEAEAVGGRVRGLPGLHSETLSWKTKPKWNTNCFLSQLL